MFCLEELKYLSMLLFWEVTPFGLVGRFLRFGKKNIVCLFRAEDGGRMFLRNVFRPVYLQVHRRYYPEE
jgi:hypothetical protein